MAELTNTALIWNRACGSDAVCLLAGDRALEALLLVHGYVMNGGVFHAVEGIDAELLADAQSGYRYFGFDDAANLFNDAKSIFESGQNLKQFEIMLGNRYTALIPDDTALFNRFEDCLRRNPSEFAPL